MSGMGWFTCIFNLCSGGTCGGDITGSGSVQNKTSGLEMCDVWAIFFPLSYCSRDAGSGDLNEEQGMGWGLWHRGSEAGVWPNWSLTSLKGVLETISGDGAKLRCDATGEGALRPWALRKGVRSVGRGGGVGGTGVEARERDGADAEGSSVRDSQSLVTACSSNRLNGE